VFKVLVESLIILDYGEDFTIEDIIGNLVSIFTDGSADYDPDSGGIDYETILYECSATISYVVNIVLGINRKCYFSNIRFTPIEWMDEGNTVTSNMRLRLTWIEDEILHHDEVGTEEEMNEEIPR
jgi:hypothetical protein